MQLSRASGLRRLVGLLSLAVALAAVAALALVQIGPEQSAAEGSGAASASTSPPAILQYRIAALDPSLVSSYQVNRTVTDFPDVEDFSTPEAAYATFNRALARGDQGIWRRASADPFIADLCAPADAPAVQVAPEVARLRLGCIIREVWIYRGSHCSVIAERPTPPEYTDYDIRSLELVDGRWLNSGNSGASTLEMARCAFAEACIYYDRQNEKYRGAVEHPELIVQMAQTLFERMRGADYDYFLNSTNPEVWKEFLYPEYTGSQRNAWMYWVCTIFSQNPIVQVELGEVFAGDCGRPTIPYTLTLRDGTILSGLLPYQYRPDESTSYRTGSWETLGGCDWHL